MSKIVLVETVSTFRHVYAVRLPDNEPNDFALEDVLMSFSDSDTKLEEVSQNHIGEDIYSHRVITEDEYLELFDRENSYLSDWEPERKKAFIYDSFKAREEQVTKEVHLNGDC